MTEREGGARSVKINFGVVSCLLYGRAEKRGASMTPCQR